MHIVVCVKQVPDTTNVRINPETNTLMREGVESIINPFDEFALEEALKLHTSHWHMPLGLLLIATALYAPKGLAALSDLWARSKP